MLNEVRDELLDEKDCVGGGSRGPYLLLSSHDYRSKRKANVHFIADELAKRSKIRFFSVGFSYLSWIRKDPRVALAGQANAFNDYNGVECFLWKTMIHPFNLKIKALESIERVFYEFYVRSRPDILVQWIKTSNTIIIESGISVCLFDLVKKTNPKAKILYVCSDALDTIGCSVFLRKKLKSISKAFDGVTIPSYELVTEFQPNSKIFYVPHGLDASLFSVNFSSPYADGINIVSVGSMLFDPSFFEIAGLEFPNYKFFVIGGGAKSKTLSLSNVIVLDEMKFAETIPYILHANAGVAPYEANKVSPYLADTSMKLMQFAAAGLPAICPTTVVGAKKGRFGYQPGDVQSIKRAVNEAISHGRFDGGTNLSWSDVTDRILEPTRFSDTRVPAHK
jgi:2-beta-glucuronyltransferase